MMKKIRTRIWIDADACPKGIKEIVFKTSLRLNIPLTLVANSQMTIPLVALINLIVVKKGSDIADQYIIDHVKEDELVITADIPLAAKIVEKKAIAINPRGEIYTEENIGEILSVRDYLKELRDSGIVTDGPAIFGPKDIHHFANSLNKLLS